MYSLAAAARVTDLPTTPDGFEDWNSEVSPRAAASLLESSKAGGSTIGEPWRAAFAAEAAERVRTIEFETEAVERGIKGHVETEKALAATLRELGISPLSPRASDPPFDVGWRYGGRLFIAEVKSLTAQNEEHQLRLGLGQVLRYRWALSCGAKRTVEALLVPEEDPRDPSWSEVCLSAGVLLLPKSRIQTELSRVVRG
jgi:hypothetical protein